MACGLAVAALSLSAGCGAKDPSSLHVANLRVEQPALGQDPYLRFVVDNRLDVSDSLVSISTPDAASVEIGRTATSGRSGTDAPVELPQQRSTSFEARGYEAQLTRPGRQLETGDEVQVTFIFGSGLQIRLLAPVVAPGAPGPDEQHR